MSRLSIANFRKFCIVKCRLNYIFQVVGALKAKWLDGRGDGCETDDLANFTPAQVRDPPPRPLS